MKKRNIFLLIAFLGIVLFSCNPEGTPPTITLDSETIVVEKGSSSNIKASISHPEGLMSVQIEQAAFNLNRTITLEEPYPTEYELDYAVTIPTTLDQSSYDITITATGTDEGTATKTLVAEVSDVVNMYLLANNVTIGETTGEWYDPSTAFQMVQSETEPHIYTLEDAEFSNGGGNDGWGVSLAVLGQTNDVVPINAVIDYSTIPEEMIDTDWWEYGNNSYVMWTNYPGYTALPVDFSEYTFQMKSHESASIPTPWVSDEDEGGYYNLDALSFYKNPGTYTITYNSNDNSLKLTLTSAPPPPEEGLFITGSGFPEHLDVDWGIDNVIAMVEGNTGEFSITDLAVEQYAELKFIGQKAWSPDNYGWATKDTLDLPVGDIVNSNSSESFVFKQSGIYDITFNENNLTYSFTRTGDYIASIDNIYVVGNGIADAAGNDASDSWYYDESKALSMTPVSGEAGKFELTFQFKDAFVKSDEGYDNAGCYFYFLLNAKSWNAPAYGVLGGTAIDDNWYVKDPADNTYEIIADGSWQSYFYYSNQDGTYKMTVDTNVDPMTCRIVKQ